MPSGPTPSTPAAGAGLVDPPARAEGRAPAGASRRIDGLAVTEYRPAPAAADEAPPLVVLVHGSLDRGASFRRVVRRLGAVRVVTYDRRGYQGSRGGPDRPLDLAAHAADLVHLVRTLDPGPRGAVAVGHSFGGAVVMTAAARSPGDFGAIAAYEPPLPWFGFRRAGAVAPPAEQPSDVEVESFFRRMVGDGAWARLTDGARAERLADGPALVADMRALHGTAEAPFDIDALRTPAVFGCGGPASTDRHRRTTAWLAAHVPDAEAVEISGAGHGAHLSHPGAFAQMVGRAAARAGSAPDRADLRPVAP